MRWFKPMGIVFLPRSIMGWLITLVLAAFCVHVYVIADMSSHTVIDTLYRIYPYWAPTFLIWVWIGSQTSEP